MLEAQHRQDLLLAVATVRHAALAPSADRLFFHRRVPTVDAEDWNGTEGSIGEVSMSADTRGIGETRGVRHRHDLGPHALVHEHVRIPDSVSFKNSVLPPKSCTRTTSPKCIFSLVGMVSDQLAHASFHHCSPATKIQCEGACAITNMP